MLANPNKMRIRQNVYDNWYGYVSGRKVIGFMNTPTETQRQMAERWLAERLSGGKPWSQEKDVIGESQRRVHVALRDL